MAVANGRAFLLLPLVALLVGYSGRSSFVARAEASGAAACGWNDPVLRAEEARVLAETWRSNVSRDVAIVHPSKAYSGVWLRDSFWTLTSLGDAALGSRALAHFASRQNHVGQVPTQFAVFLRGPIYKPDESTLLFLIWAGWEAQHRGRPPSRTILLRALGYVRTLAPAGLYLSRAGDYTSWFDSFRLRRTGTLAYNQGLYAVAMQSARALRLGVGDAEVAQAAAGYRSLIDRRHGYLRMGSDLNYHDISGLAGEFLSLWLFHRPLLSDAAVRATLATQPGFRGGFAVVVDGGGRYLPRRAFTVHLSDGAYQNGGSWLLFDYLALATGWLHHLPGIAERMRSRLEAEFEAGPTFREYLDTNPQSIFYGTEPAWRDGFAWNTFIFRVDAVLAARCLAEPVVNHNPFHRRSPAAYTAMSGPSHPK